VIGGERAVARREGCLGMKLSTTWVMALLLATAGCKTKDEPSGAVTNTAGSGGTTTATVDAEGGADGVLEVRRGERGSSCNATSDCADELSCVVTHDCPAGVACANKSCQPSNFGLMGTGKSCHISECASTADCCGDMPLQAPAKCANRDSICNRPTLPDCTTIRCASSAECGKGSCVGRCSLDALDTCLTSADCALNTCDTALEPDVCSVTSVDCSSFACTTNTCSLPYCNCTNPDYLPTSPICSDPDCEGICGFTCTKNRCVVDNRCTADAECGATTPFCQDGNCLECRTRDDCEDEECVDGHCGPACEADSQCALFEACQAGKCTYVGCRTDRECVLQAGQGAPTQDPRLAKCKLDNGLGSCVFPCEIDAQCAPSELCFEGTCKYIGCETDAECKTIAGLHNLPVPTPERPWLTTAVCKAEDAATP
jgi:hypothetical protein